MSEKLSSLFLSNEHKKRQTMVLAAAQDKNALEAAVNAFEKKIIDLILVGNKEEILHISEKSGINLSSISVYNEKDVGTAAEISVRMVSEGKADIVMKGNLSTSILLKAVLNKDWGLRSGELLSHLALFELKNYHKILALTDAAMNVAPGLKEKTSIIKNSVNYLNRLQITNPKVAILSAMETVNPDISSTVEASALSKMAERGQIANCIIDGPMALDNAISKESAEIKKIISPVAGDADLLVGHDLETSNALYKSLIYFGNASCAAVIVGAKAPIVLTSRADTDETKLNSIALAAAAT